MSPHTVEIMNFTKIPLNMPSSIPMPEMQKDCKKCPRCTN